MSSTTPPTEDNAVVTFLRARWLSLLVLVIAVVFIAVNRDDVTISLLVARVHAPLWVVLAGVFVAGWLVGIVRTRRKAR